MILVTGATGFLGSELVRQLILQGHSVRALKRPDSVIPNLLSEYQNIDWVEGDMLDQYSLETAIEGVSKVYHCAAVISFRKEDKNKMLSVNVEGTAMLVNICLHHHIQKLVHASSISAIGENKTGDPANEDDHWVFSKKQSNYAVSKYESEMEVFRGTAEGLNAVIVNPSIIIGKDACDKGSGQLFNMVRKGLKFYPGGSCGVVDVEDVARIMIELMDSDIINKRFILNSENISYLDLFTAIARGYGLGPPTIRLRQWMLRSGLSASLVVKTLTGYDFGITREVANSIFKTLKYSNRKITEALNPTFKPVNKSILEICGVHRD